MHWEIRIKTSKIQYFFSKNCFVSSYIKKFSSHRWHAWTITHTPHTIHQHLQMLRVWKYTGMKVHWCEKTGYENEHVWNVRIPVLPCHKPALHSIKMKIINLFSFNNLNQWDLFRYRATLRMICFYLTGYSLYILVSKVKGQLICIIMAAILDFNIGA